LFVSCAFLFLLFLLITVYWKEVKSSFYKATGIENRADNSKLVVGTNLWIGYESFYFARDLGFYNDTPIRFVEHLSATQQIRAFRNRTIQAATLTLDEVLLLLEQGHNPKVVMVIDISHGGDVIIGNSYIKNLKDLQGRRVAVENTAVGGYIISRALEMAELTPNDITVVPLQINELERAFMEGEVDAVVTFEPMKSRLLNQGARLLFDSSEIPGEIVDVLVVPNEILELYSDKIEIILKGWFRATTHLRDHSKDAAQRMSTRLRISPADVLIAFEGLELPSIEKSLEMMTSSPLPPLLATAHKLAEHMMKKGLLIKKVDLNNFLAPEILQRLTKSNAESHQ